MQATIVRYDRATAASTSRFEIGNAAAPPAAALHRHGDRDRRSRGAGARCRAQRDRETVRRDDRAPPEGGAPPATATTAAQAGAPPARARAGDLRTADLVKPELVQRNENVTMVYEAPGITLTMRGKALEAAPKAT